MYKEVDYSTLDIWEATLFGKESFLRLVKCIARLFVAGASLELAVAGGEDQGAATVKFSAAESKSP